MQAAGGLFNVVSDGTNKAGYSYLANSPLVSQIRLTNNRASCLHHQSTKSRQGQHEVFKPSCV